jgi:hypothetical protein
MFSNTIMRKLVKTDLTLEAVLFAVLALLVSQVAMLDILPYEGSTLTLLVIAVVVVVALAFFRLIVPLIIAAIIVIVMIILIFGGIPVPSLLT